MAIFLALTACTVDKQLNATGGSRADGVVELSYEIGMLQNARIDWIKADHDAIQRCNAWGYSHAERFGGEKRQCNEPSTGGCAQWFVSINYQCVGQKAASQ
jgi:hypothetical protein